MQPRLTAVVLALALGFVLLRCLPVLGPILAVAIDHCGAYACDFEHVFWRQAVAMREPPIELAERWFYPPLAAVVLAPLGWLALDRALGVWTLANLACAAWLVALCARALGGWERRWRLLAAAGLVGLSLPVWHCVRWGQISLLLTVPALWALTTRHRLTAPLLGLAAGIKVYPLAWTAALLARRRWRRSVATVAWAVGLGALLPLVVLGRSAGAFFERVLVAPVGPEVTALGGQALGPSLVRWFADGRHAGVPEDPAPLLFDLGQAGAAVLEVLGVVVLLVLLVRWLRREDLDETWIPVAVVVALALVLRPGWHHYFVAVPLAQACALGAARGRSATAWLAGFSVAVGAVPLVLLRDVPFAYFHASQWGVTTVSALLALGALLTLRDPSPSAASPAVPPGPSEPVPTPRRTGGR